MTVAAKLNRIARAEARVKPANVPITIQIIAPGDGSDSGMLMTPIKGGVQYRYRVNGKDVSLDEYLRYLDQEEPRPGDGRVADNAN